MSAPEESLPRKVCWQRLPIIARTPRILAALAAVVGLAAWGFYFYQDLVLSHYDAKAHLVVARRIIDNLTPGWRQIGAVWLPLPHLLQVLPTQIDGLYRTGAFGSLLSIGSLATTVWAFARTVLIVTGSPLGAWTSAALVLSNPNLLYIHATPMTEPLLIATCALAVLWTTEWLGRGQGLGKGDRGSGIGDQGSGIGDRGSGIGSPPLRLGLVLFAAAWTRYEAWAVIGALSAVVTISLWQKDRRGRGSDPRSLIPDPYLHGLHYLAWPAAAILLFLLNSRITVGDWLVSGGFYVPDPAYQRHGLKDLIGVWWGTHQLSGYVSETVALITAAWLGWRVVTGRRPALVLCTLCLLAAGALPFYALFEGHPYRIRYMVPMVAATALLCGLAIGSVAPGRLRHLAVAVLLLASLVESPTWAQRTPLLVEATWDVPISLDRRIVRACLARDYRGEKVLASMGSLAHLMQELSHDGFAIADFIHEGNGSLWELALETGPAPHAGWMLVEESSEGGDVLARRIRGDRAFVAGMTRVCEGGGVGLYRRERQAVTIGSQR